MQYKPSSDVSRQALVQAGLTAHQAAVYEALIQYGPQKATRAAFLAGVPRTLSYKVLSELEAEGLVTKNDKPGRVSVFVPTHPLELKRLVKRRLDSVKAAEGFIEQVLPDLIVGFDQYLGTLSESELYARVALYAGKAELGPLSASEKLAMQKVLQDLLNKIT